MAGGHVVADGTPKEVFADEGLKAVGLTVPETVELRYELRQEGWRCPWTPLSDEECAQALYRLLEKKERIPMLSDPEAFTAGRNLYYLFLTFIFYLPFAATP